MAVQLTAFLMVNGNAKEAIEFYKKSLDAQLLFIQRFGDAPEDPERPLPNHLRDLVAHAVMAVGESKLMISDGLPGVNHQIGNQVTICITTNEIEKTQQFYESLHQDGEIIMPLQKTHFSPAYGIVTDKFGVTFQLFTATSEAAVARGHQKES